jgi:CRISPR-associated protein Cmr1
MKQLRYEVRFTTPAFLGNAAQDAQWRTPPFKALLRQWWRVAHAAEHGFRVDLRRMRFEEGMLFGHAWLHEDSDSNGKNAPARKSAVRIRLQAAGAVLGDSWTRGTQKGVTPLPTDQSTSHAWFGLIRRGGQLSDRTAIKATGMEASRSLHIAFPSAYDARIRETLHLIDAFGLLGSRSRGGWGSVVLVGGTTLVSDHFVRFSRDWEACLDEDWAMSLAKDARPWIWHSTRPYPQWHEAMRDIALERKRVREALKTKSGTNLRIALGFAGKGRMPSPLRWKIVADGSGQLWARAFAMPHRLPAQSGDSLREAELKKAWANVCASLDDSKLLVRA